MPPFHVFISLFLFCAGRAYFSPACLSIACSVPFFSSLLCIGTVVCFPVCGFRSLRCEVPGCRTSSKPFAFKYLTISFGVIGICYNLLFTFLLYYFVDRKSTLFRKKIAIFLIFLQKEKARRTACISVCGLCLFIGCLCIAAVRWRCGAVLGGLFVASVLLFDGRRFRRRCAGLFLDRRLEFIK